jgi:hypothetical protein
MATLNSSKKRAEQYLNQFNVELSMGRLSGLQGSYHKPSEKDLLADYLNAVRALTINDDTSILQNQVNELTQRKT